MDKTLENSIRINLISGLGQCTNGQILLFKRMYSHGNLNTSIDRIVHYLPVSKLMMAMKQIDRTLALNNGHLSKSNGVNNMANATGYKPMASKNVKYTQKHPDEIFRCVDKSTGKYVLVKKYVFKGIKPDRIDVEDCKLDHPAECIFNGKDSVILDQEYSINMINYYFNNGNINEYEIRSLIMLYLKKIRKSIDKNVFKSVCDVFDKTDKMLSRCDRRKNNNVYEADVSYKFLIKNYKKIICMVEAEVNPAKKKVEVEVEFDCDSTAIKHTGSVQAPYSKLTKDMVKNMHVKPHEALWYSY